ncbi:MAG TPA: DUF4192 domain-containing protein [Candidatus Limnocylindrales bacterium]
MSLQVSLRTREDLLAITPYQLGFHPDDSVVVLGFSRHRLKLAARCDADAPPHEMIRQFSTALVRVRGVRAVALLAYGKEWVAEPTKLVSEGLRKRGFQIVQTLRITGTRYFCLACEDCTPASGVPFDPSASAAAASCTFAGLVARPDRDSVERLVRPIGGLAGVAMAQAVDRAEQRLAGLRDNAELVAEGRLAVDAAFELTGAGERLDDDRVAWLSVLIADTEVRDHAWARTDSEDWQLDLWLDLTRRAEPILATPFAALLGWCAWRRGDGVLAWAALERAHRIDPTYALTNVLLGALRAAQPPSTIGQWPPPKSRPSR